MFDVQVALFDVSGTLTTVNAWRGITNAPLITKGRRRWMMGTMLPWWALHKAGLYSEIHFRDRWIRALARLLRGYTAEEVTAIFGWGVENYLAELYREDVLAELRHHQNNGAVTVIVSNIFQGFVDQLVQRFATSGGIGTRLAYRNNKVTGKIDGVPCAGEQKVLQAEAWLSAHGHQTINLSEAAAAYADSISDVPLLSAVAFPTATYPDVKLMKVATQRKWRVLS
jgi:phosphoserine phosphatase